MRLIDADLLLEANGLKDAVKYGNKTPEQQHNSYSSMMLYEIADIIDDAPTVDPVTHGRWVEAKVQGMSLYPDGQKMCSVCETIMPHTWKTMPNYCFNCGAKLGVEQEAQHG